MTLLPWFGMGLILGQTLGAQSAGAQAIAPAADGTGTTVSQQGQRFDISGGALSDNGQNLFHSFERFGLGRSQMANFIAAPEIRNILGRVTGGEASYINGEVQVGNGTASLVLINPAGLLTGVNSRIEVPGSFTAATADWLGFDGTWLNVLEAGAFSPQDAALNGFGFSAAAPGAVVNEGQISVGVGEQLRLLGGTVLNTGELMAPGGEITLLSVLGGQQARFGADGAIALGPTVPGAAPLLTLKTAPELLAARSPEQASQISVNAAGEVQLLGQVNPGGPPAPSQLDADGSLETSQLIAPGSTVTGDLDTTTNSNNGPANDGAIRIVTDGNFQGGNFISDGSITITARGNIRAGDLNTHPSANSNDATNNGAIQIATDGSFQGGNLIGDGSITIAARDDIQAGNLDTYGEIEKSNIRVTTSGSFQGGKLISAASDIMIDAQGDIQTGRILAFGNGDKSEVRLKSKTGSIQVSTIESGSGGIDVEAAQSFRVLDSFQRTFSGFQGDETGLLSYLVSLGHDRETLENRETLEKRGVSLSDTTAMLSLLARHSGGVARDKGKTYEAPISIRIGDQAKTIIDQTPPEGQERGRILILADSQSAFRSGAAFDENPLYKPENNTDRIEDFDPENPFRFTSTPGTPLTYGSDEFPLGSSGLSGSIAVGNINDSGLYASLQDQTFDPVATPTPAPAPTPIQTSSSNPSPNPAPSSNPVSTSAAPSNRASASRSAASAQRQAESSNEICSALGFDNSAASASMPTGIDQPETEPHLASSAAQPQADLTCASASQTAIAPEALLRSIAAPTLPEDAILPEFSDGSNRKLIELEKPK